jgi:hypothetical protein
VYNLSIYSKISSLEFQFKFQFKIKEVLNHLNSLLLKSNIISINYSVFSLQSFWQIVMNLNEKPVQHENKSILFPESIHHHMSLIERINSSGGYKVLISFCWCVNRQNVHHDTNF